MNTNEPQPRGAQIRPGRRIDHDEAATRFLAAPHHAQMHDARLWDLRGKRDAQMHAIPEWEELRELASAIKQHTLSRLDEYLEQFEAQARANGVHVHWAVDAAEHNRIVHGILGNHGAKRVIKSKSMLTEECGLRHYLGALGIEVVETDLGERIQQLDNEDPSHIVVPAVHKTRADVAQVFARTIGTSPGNDDVHYLAESQREATRPLILEADAGMTGANFAVAETGGFVVCTNEGNADLFANVLPLHIASIGIEKLVPRVADLGVFIRLTEHGSKRLEEMLRAGELDLAGLLLPLSSEFQWQEHYRSPIVALVPYEHPLAGRKEISLAELAQMPFVLLNEGFAMNPMLLEACRRHGFRPQIHAICCKYPDEAL